MQNKKLQKKQYQHNYNNKKVTRKAMSFEQLKKGLDAIIPKDIKRFKALPFEKALQAPKALVILNKKRWEKLTNRVISVSAHFQKFKQIRREPKLFHDKKKKNTT